MSYITSEHQHIFLTTTRFGMHILETKLSTFFVVIISTYSYFNAKGEKY